MVSLEKGSLGMKVATALYRPVKRALKVVMMVNHEFDSDKPLLRGKIHLALLYLCPLWIPYFYEHAHNACALISVTVTVASLLVNFGASAVYHNVRLPSDASILMNKIDHCAIFVLIAGSVTPLVVMLSAHMYNVLLHVCLHWGSVFVGTFYIVFRNFSLSSSKHRHASKNRATIYVAFGFSYLVTLLDFARKLVPLDWVLIVCLALSYILGATIYAGRFPDPFPRVLGYHELFHLFCLLAAVSTVAVNHQVLKRVGRSVPPWLSSFNGTSVEA
eukprot:GHVU01110511.1.p1 GENE.GHVU01110511.1~~GHVU01110511.1.p1  ORF type:complete len:274 (+),score=6.76 GHVU01110511.1:50-871(+)